MADILEVSGCSYQVKDYPELFVKAMKKGSNNLLDNFTVIPNVTKDARVTKFMGVDDILQADGRNCSWDPSTGQEMGEKDITVKNYKINAEECLEKLDNLRSRQIFEADPEINGDMPDNVYEAFRNDILRSVGLSIEKLAFGSGDDSLVTKLAADDDVVKVTGTTLTAANIIGEIEKVIDDIPDAVYQDQYFDNARGGAKLFVSIKAARLLRKAAGTSATSVNVLQPRLSYNDGKYYFDEVEIVPVASLATNTMVACSKANVVFATNLLDELTTLDIERGKNITDRNKLYAYMDFRAVFDYVFPDECVVYA